MLGKNILVADDDQGILYLLSEVLENDGYNLFLAINGKQAIEIADSNPIDVALLDWKMPITDGFEALKEIKAIDQNTEVLIMTGYADMESLDQLMAYGASDYIIKPFHPKDISQAVRNALLKRNFAIENNRVTVELKDRIAQLEREYEHRTRELRESQIKYKQIVESSNDAIVVAQDGIPQFVNPKALELTGYTQDEILVLPFDNLIHPDDRIEVEDRHLKRIDGVEAFPTFAFRAVRKDMESIWVEINAVRTIWQGRPATIYFIRDITERKRAEEALKGAYAQLKEAQEKLIQSEKLAALGRFSSGIAHEIKNPLGIILGGVGFLEKRLTPVSKEVKVAINKIRESTLRADTIIQGLLQFARPSELRVERIRPEEIIRDTVALLEYRTPLRNIEIITQISKENVYIQVDKNQIQQVLFNLLLNAVEAMPKGGKIHIKVDKDTIFELVSERHVCIIQISDTGYGISRDHLGMVFEPFFTTKRDRKGTGLGLSISRMIMEKHQGSLTINSEPGRGTEAKIILPLH